MEERPEVQEAIRRLPEEEQYERLFRLKRALDLSMKKAVLPPDQWTTPEQVRSSSPPLPSFPCSSPLPLLPSSLLPISCLSIPHLPLLPSLPLPASFTPLLRMLPCLQSSSYSTPFSH